MCDIGVSDFRTSAPTRWRRQARRQSSEPAVPSKGCAYTCNNVCECDIERGGTRPFLRSLLYFIIYLYCCCYRFVCFYGGGVRIAACGIYYTYVHDRIFNLQKKTPPTLVPHNLYVHVCVCVRVGRKATRVFVYAHVKGIFGGIPSPPQMSLLLSGRSDFLGIELALSSTLPIKKNHGYNMLTLYILERNC